MNPDTRELKKVLDGITSGVKNVVAQCIAAGKLLVQLKSKSKDGDWKLILESVELSWHSADRYMALWEHRTELNLKDVKSLSDAYKIVSAVSFKIGKPADTDKPKSTTYKAKTPELTIARPSITADTDNSRFYTSSPTKFHVEPRIRTTTEDSALVEEFAGYPKTFKVEVLLRNEDQETRLRALIVHIEEENGTMRPVSKTPTRDLLASMVTIYKKVLGITLRPSGPDSGSARAFVKNNGADCFSEVLDVFERACVMHKREDHNSFSWVKQCEQPCTFFKFYNHIRNEVNSNATHQKPSRPGADRNAGTANAKTIGQYDDLGKVV